MSLEGEVVLVTGADGFIGSHLVECLVTEGARVRAFCLYNSNGSLGWCDTFPPDVSSEVEFVLGDIRDPGFVERAVNNVDVVLHLAALISIPYSYEAPASFVEVNVVGTMNVLEAARHAGVRRMVHTSTSEVYGTPDEVPISEAHPLKGQSPYSASKIAADKLCEAWACAFNLPVVVLRPFNTYGPRQSMRAIIPTIIAQLLAKEPMLHLGSLEPRRDFTFVTDTVDGFVRAATADVAAGEVIQLGTGRSVSIGELVERLMDIVGEHPDVMEESIRLRPPRSEVQTLVSNPATAHALLGWTPSVGFDEGLARTVEWTRSNRGAMSPTRYYR